MEEPLVETWAIHNRINVYLLDAISEESLSLALPKCRSVLDQFAHVHNVRLMWLKAAGVTALPAKLAPATASKQQAIQALEESGQAIESTLRPTIDGDGRIKGFKPDVAGFFAYLVAHDAHHRGQITMLARQLGHPVSQSVMFGMWEWGTR